ncbi:MAG: NADH-quinone oxidoreductase subunit L [Burkholderiales bacterium]|nr:NADH-quinone oxidoreductase subunit L [Burkholderiales bacterium]
MAMSDLLPAVCALAPAVFMLLVALLARSSKGSSGVVWTGFAILSSLASVSALTTLAIQWLGQHLGYEGQVGRLLPGLMISQLSAWLAVLVQLLGTVIGVFSARYLQGELGQRRYVVGLSSVLAAVQILLLADHWLVLFAAWAWAGVALQQLLCFYPDRPFALLAAHKKRIADRLADALLMAAAALAYLEIGNGSISELLRHVASHGASVALQLSAVCLVLAVIVRTALLPVHGWLIQVMEAPTPVSALLHAGVVNLGGYVLIRFAPLLDASSFARWLLVIFGLSTALLAGFVMLTRISIKVRLAWSTVAQMGFMVLECGLGLYQLAVLHLIGHSLYKAHTFLSASTVVRQTRLQMMHGASDTMRFSLLAAPVLAFATVALVQSLSTGAVWPWWWSAVLALAWAPIFWLPAQISDATPPPWLRLLAGFGMTVLLTSAALLGHVMPLGVSNAPNHVAGIVTLLGMALMYLGLAILQGPHRGLAAWRRWSYAGFYIDELYTRFALKHWPTRWAGSVSTAYRPAQSDMASAAVPQ